MFQTDESKIREIDRWIEDNRDQFLHDLNELVAIPSISAAGGEPYPYGESCAKVLDRIAEIAGDYGFPMENHEYRCATLTQKGSGDSDGRIGMYAHLDVVPLGEGWYNPPLKASVKDGFLVGRGVIDDKGPGLCMLYALRYLKEHGIQLKHDVMLYFGCSEETGMEDIEYFCREYHDKIGSVNLVADTNFPVCYGEKGILRVTAFRHIDGNLAQFSAGSVVNIIPSAAEAAIAGLSLEKAEELFGSNGQLAVGAANDGMVHVTARGISRHAAFPEGSVNAIHVLAKALAESGVLSGSAAGTAAAAAHMTSDAYGCGCGIACEDEASGKLTCTGNVARLEDGVFSLAFDIRYPVTIDGAELVERFVNCVQTSGFHVEINELSAPSYVSPDQPFIQCLCEISDFVQGKHYEPYTMGGGTYARHLPNAVGFGPGCPDAPNPFENGHGQGHQPDECVPFDVLLKGLKSYILALEALDRMI